MLGYSLLAWIPIIGWLLSIAMFVLFLLGCLDIAAKCFGQGTGYAHPADLFPSIMVFLSILGFRQLRVPAHRRCRVGAAARRPWPADGSAVAPPPAPPAGQQYIPPTPGAAAPPLAQPLMPQPLAPPPSQAALPTTPPPAQAAPPAAPAPATPYATPPAEAAAPTTPPADTAVTSTPPAEAAAPSPPPAEPTPPESPHLLLRRRLPDSQPVLVGPYTGRGGEAASPARFLCPPTDPRRAGPTFPSRPPRALTPQRDYKAPISRSRAGSFL